MVTVRDGLASAGIATMTFNYAYAESGRRSPDRSPKLLEVHRGAAERLSGYVGRIVLAGKSMGGRVGSHLAGDEAWPAAGLVYLGYPLVPMGKGEPRATDHLERIDAPQLFVCGTRDRLSPPGQIVPLAARLRAADVHVVAHGDHSFNVPKRSGTTTDVVLASIVEIVAAWVKTRPGE
jgi:predicted alpha/beta-hydrolase family hydrolase